MSGFQRALLLALSIGAFALPCWASEEEVGSCTGIINWAIHDRTKGKLVRRGQTHVAKEDVRVERVTHDDGSVSYQEHIDLGDHFEIGISNFAERERSDLTGFGMWFERTDLRTFSWEWFTITNENEARKLQGEGTLFVTVDSRPSGWQITRTAFLSPAVFRACIFGRRPCRTRWTLTISKGSCIDW